MAYRLSGFGKQGWELLAATAVKELTSLTDLRLTITLDTKIHHFRDVLASQPFSMALKKLNLRQQKQTLTTQTRNHQQTERCCNTKKIK